MILKPDVVERPFQLVFRPFIATVASQKEFTVVHCSCFVGNEKMQESGLSLTERTRCWITVHPVGCRDPHGVIKINALEIVSSLLEHVI